MTISTPATKQDVEEIVGRVVGEIVGGALQMISDRFDKVDMRMDNLESRMDGLAVRMSSLEDKTGSIGEAVEHHAIDIRGLKRKTV